MSKVDYKQLAREVLDAVGKENVVSVVHCATRLRFVLKDESVVSNETVEKINGVKGVVQAGGLYQIVVGSKVSIVHEEVTRLLGFEAAPGTEEKDGNIFNRLITTMASIFSPLLIVMCGAGMVKGVIAILTTFAALGTDSSTYVILNAIGDSIFKFMPLALSVTAARKFKCNEWIAFAISAAMLYPTIGTWASSGNPADFFGIPVTMIDYSSSVLPILVMVYALSKLEKLLKDFVPEAVYNFVTPFVCMAVITPVALIVIGPAFTWVSTMISNAYMAISAISPLIPGIIIGGGWQILTTLGIHQAFINVMLINLTTLGFDTMSPIISPANFSQTGAALGVFLKSKRADVKQVAGSAFISALFGITEPTLYGVSIRYKKPFYMATIGGAIGGVIVAMAGSQVSAIAIPGILTFPAFIGPGFGGLLLGTFVSFAVSTVLTYLFGYNDSMAE